MTDPAVKDTVLQHPEVLRYLRLLDEACARLPRTQARELREQISSHLDEALPPDADDATVQAELTRLGLPYDIAAAASGPGRPSLTRRAFRRLSRVRWWAWTAFGVIIAGLGTGGGFLVSMNSAPPLVPFSAEWLYSADQAHATQVTAGGITQITTPARLGQRQGIKLLLANSSDWTQQIVGIGPHFGAFSEVPWQAAVQTGPDINGFGVPLAGGTSWVAWGSIPPHATRWVRLSWVTDPCGIGGAGIDWVPLQVRLGAVTRTETIPLLNQELAMQWPKDSKCGQ